MRKLEQSGWDRFQALLEGLRPGDHVEVTAAAQQTGLPPHTCAHVLEALERVELFTRLDGQQFVRRRLFQAMDRLDAR
jgi:hypothetical protein